MLATYSAFSVDHDLVTLTIRDKGRMVGIATRYRLDGPEFDLAEGRGFSYLL